MTPTTLLAPKGLVTCRTQASRHTVMNKLTHSNCRPHLTFPKLESLRGRIQHQVVPGQEVALSSSPRSSHNLELQADTKC